NFARPTNLGVYRFLCALQNQGAPRMGFSWNALEAARFLPRVRVGRVVLALARWRLTGHDLDRLTQATGAQQFVAAAALRRAYGLPRRVAVVDGDRTLPVDFDNVLSLETFVQLVKERKEVVLRELFGIEEPCVRGPEGHFQHELVIPLISAPRT